MCKVWYWATGFCYNYKNNRRRLRLFIRPFGKALVVAFAWIFFALLRLVTKRYDFKCLRFYKKGNAKNTTS
jgi:hypothetical protein